MWRRLTEAGLLVLDFRRGKRWRGRLWRGRGPDALVRCVRRRRGPIGLVDRLGRRRRRLDDHHLLLGVEGLARAVGLWLGIVVDGALGILLRPAVCLGG
jgi:hypothetical protein